MCFAGLMFLGKRQRLEPSLTPLTSYLLPLTSYLSPLALPAVPSTRQPPVRARAQVELNRLQFRKLVDRKSSQLAAQTALFVAAERKFRVTVHKRVNPDRSGANRSSDLERHIDVSSPDRRG